MARALPPSFYRLAARATCPNIPPLDGSRRADVCVVGGGFTGLSAAHPSGRGRRRRGAVEADRIAERRLRPQRRADPFRPAARRALAGEALRLRARQAALGHGGGGEGAGPRADRPLRHSLRPPRRRHRGAAQAVADARGGRAGGGADRPLRLRPRRRCSTAPRRPRRSARSASPAASTTAAAAISTPTASRSASPARPPGSAPRIHENTPARLARPRRRPGRAHRARRHPRRPRHRRDRRPLRRASRQITRRRMVGINSFIVVTEPLGADGRRDPARRRIGRRQPLRRPLLAQDRRTGG